MHNICIVRLDRMNCLILDQCSYHEHVIAQNNKMYEVLRDLSDKVDISK